MKARPIYKRKRLMTGKGERQKIALETQAIPETFSIGLVDKYATMTRVSSFCVIYTDYYI